MSMTGGGGGGGDGSGGAEGEGEGGRPGVGAGASEPFDPDRGEGIVVDGDGSMTLGGAGPVVVEPLIWVANSAEGTVSKLDTRTHLEIGRYRTGPGSGWELSPSRTAVNRDGHVVVANRGVTSAARILASGCTDVDGDGVVRTSAGGADVLPWGEDECLAWYTTFGDPSSAARGTVVEERGGLDGVFEEVAWVGAYGEARMYEIATADGALTGRTVDVTPVYPYGAALAADGKVWVCGDADLASFDTTTLAVVQHPLPAGRFSYGIAVDAQGDVWTGGTIQRFRPATGEWDWPAGAEGWSEDDWENEGDFAGGVAADARGFVWAAKGMAEGGIDRIDIRTLEVLHVDTGGSEHGVAPDADGMIWGIDFEGTSASIVDPETLEVARVTPPFVGAYTYSDMTGSQAGLQTRDRGRYRHTFEACPGGDRPTWGALTWDALVPAGAHATFAVRTGDDPTALEPAAGVVVASVGSDEPPVDVGAALAAAGLAQGRTLELEVTLVSDDGEHAPTVLWFAVDHSCEGFLE
jgi:DNA-binding beta-propeller fold protein YncE